MLTVIMLLFNVRRNMYSSEIAEMQELQKTINLASAQIAALITRFSGSASNQPEPAKWVDQSGHLSPPGIRELTRRLEALQDNKTIANAMGISTSAVAARRKLWGGRPSHDMVQLSADNPQKYRQFQNGRLNEAGENEVLRLLGAGESDHSIALALGISIPSAYKRRKMWQRRQTK
jgi:FixJ family two-component response regulator